MNWCWVDQRALVLLHDESLAEHGGSSGLRDAALLESALSRARNVADHESPGFAAPATAYAHGIAKNHPFVDGNKRAAFLAAGIFLRMNGWRLTATQAEATVAVFGLAAGEIEEAAFARWIRDHSTRLGR